MKELGTTTVEELLLLTALICEKQPARGRRAATRFLERYLANEPQTTIDDAALIAALLAALGGAKHDQALAAILDMLETANRQVRLRPLAS